MAIIFTDGASRGNPGPGGWGVIVVGDDTVTEIGGREEYTTNNRMEVMAALAGLEKTTKREPTTVYTDSVYLLSGATRWVYGWQKNNWKTSQKEDVLNRDLWERMLSALKERRNLSWELLKGHSGVPANERCDVIATSFADGKPIVLYSGSRERYGVSLGLAVRNEIKAEAKKRNKGPAYSYVSLVKGVIQIHKTWEECKARVHRLRNVKYKKALSPADEQEIIKEFTVQHV